MRSKIVYVNGRVSEEEVFCRTRNDWPRKWVKKGNQLWISSSRLMIVSAFALPRASLRVLSDIGCSTRDVSPLLIYSTRLSAPVSRFVSKKSSLREVWKLRSPLCEKIAFQRWKVSAADLITSSPLINNIRWHFTFFVMLWPSTMLRIVCQQAENSHATRCQFSQLAGKSSSAPCTFPYYRDFLPSRLDFANNYNFVGRCERIAKSEQRVCYIMSNKLCCLIFSYSDFAKAPPSRDALYHSFGEPRVKLHITKI